MVPLLWLGKSECNGCVPCEVKNTILILTVLQHLLQLTLYGRGDLNIAFRLSCSDLLHDVIIGHIDPCPVHIGRALQQHAQPADPDNGQIHFSIRIVLGWETVIDLHNYKLSLIFSHSHWTRGWSDSLKIRTRTIMIPAVSSFDKNRKCPNTSTEFILLSLITSDASQCWLT